MFFRVFLDKPVGIAVGFKPDLSWDDLEEVIVILDDKSPSAKAFVLPTLYEAIRDGGPQVAFFAVLQCQPGQSIRVYDKDIYPEPDLLIWRTQEEFRNWYNEYHGQTVVDQNK